MIRIDRVSMQHGKQILFVEASAAINRGEHVGLVGPNGAGESTLFRLITRQAVAETMDGAGPISTVAAELAKLEHALADPDQADRLEKLLERFGEVQARFEELGGYGLEAKAREILAGLGFSQAMMDGDVGSLS